VTASTDGKTSKSSLATKIGVVMGMVSRSSPRFNRTARTSAGP
jgi:hypothetical protein